jgi:hypothetical protein
MDVYPESGANKFLRNVGTYLYHTRCHDPEDGNINTHSCEDFKSQITRWSGIVSKYSWKDIVEAYFKVLYCHVCVRKYKR